MLRGGCARGGNKTKEDGYNVLHLELYWDNDYKSRKAIPYSSGFADGSRLSAWILLNIEYIKRDINHDGHLNNFFNNLVTGLTF